MLLKFVSRKLLPGIIGCKECLMNSIWLGDTLAGSPWSLRGMGWFSFCFMNFLFGFTI